MSWPDSVKASNGQNVIMIFVASCTFSQTRICINIWCGLVSMKNKYTRTYPLRYVYGILHHKMNSGNHTYPLIYVGAQKIQLIIFNIKYKAILSSTLHSFIRLNCFSKAYCFGIQKT